MDYSQFLNMIPEATSFLCRLRIEQESPQDLCAEHPHRRSAALSAGALLLGRACNSLRWPVCIICHR